MSKKMERPHGPMGPGGKPMNGPDGKPFDGPGPKGPHGGPHGGPGGKPGINPNTLSRLIKMLFKFYPVMVPVTIGCIVIAAISSAMPAIFQQKVLADIGEWYLTGDWAGAAKVIMPKVFLLLGIYIVAWFAILCYTQLMAFITQGFLDKMRREMFD